jgi:hypothetical protein
MKLTQTYTARNEADTDTDQVNGTTTFGKTSQYTEILIPFKLDQEGEKLTLSGTNITKKIIIPEK